MNSLLKYTQGFVRFDSGILAVSIKFIMVYLSYHSYRVCLIDIVAIAGNSIWVSWLGQSIIFLCIALMIYIVIGCISTAVWGMRESQTILRLSIVSTSFNVAFAWDMIAYEYGYSKPGAQRCGVSTKWQSAFLLDAILSRTLTTDIVPYFCSMSKYATE